MPEFKYYLEMEGVSYKWDGQPRLSNVSFSLVAGEFLAIGGSDISGKSSLLKLCIGLVSPDNGTIRINGKTLAGFSYSELQRLRAKTGFVFQDGVLISNLTIRDNVALPLRYHMNMENAEAYKQVDEYLELLNLVMYANERPAGLPLEIKLMANLARALVAQPELLLLDEFFDNISGPNSNRAVEYLKEMKKKNPLTCLSTTKPVNLLTSFAEESLVDCIMLIESGRVVEQGQCQIVRDKLLKKLL